jgi:hypothetical protein
MNFLAGIVAWFFGLFPTYEEPSLDELDDSQPLNPSYAQGIRAGVKAMESDVQRKSN